MRTIYTKGMNRSESIAFISVLGLTITTFALQTKVYGFGFILAANAWILYRTYRRKPILTLADDKVTFYGLRPNQPVHVLKKVTVDKDAVEYFYLGRQGKLTPNEANKPCWDNAIFRAANVEYLCLFYKVDNVRELVYFPFPRKLDIPDEELRAILTDYVGDRFLCRV